MDNFRFFDLIFEQDNPKVSKTYLKDDENKQRVKNNMVNSETTLADEFTNFFYRHNLFPLFTNEHRAQPITVSWIQASELIKSGSRPHKLLKEFANWIAMAQDNKKYEEAVFKILYNSRDWRGFLKEIQDHLNYFPYITDGYFHNSWNIVFYDKDKSGTKVSKGI